MNKPNYVAYITSIIIPTRENEKDLIDCLSAISQLDNSNNKLDIIIWDNNSSQESKKKVKDYLLKMNTPEYLKLAFIENEENYGVYTSRDELLKRVGGHSQFVLSIDDDVILPPQFLIRFLPLFDRDKSIGVIGPRIVYDDILSETAHGAGFVNKWLGRYTTKDARTVVECDYVIGCCMLIKKEVFDTIGGFDRDYYTSHGEVDFCLRAKNKGFKVLYDPSVVVRHRVDKGGTRNIERLYYVYRNKLLVIKKNFLIPQKWTALFIHFLLWFPKAIIDSIRFNKNLEYEEIKIIIRAMLDGWLNRFGKRI